MPEPIAPAIEIPLAINLDGSVGMPALEFSPDGSLLYVRQPVAHSSTWEYAKWYAPDVAAVLLPIAIVIGLFVLRRVLRTPREHGKVYCRRCNYTLTPPLADRDVAGRVVTPEEARCPECGSVLARVRPVIGRRRGARLWPFWCVLAPLILVCLVVLPLTLKAFTPMTRLGAWPFPGVQPTLARLGLGSLLLQKRHQPNPFLGTNRITRYALPGGKRVGAAWEVDTHGFENGRLAAGGGVYISVVKSPARGTLNLMSIETQTGVRRSTAIAPWTAGADILGTSPDGESVYVQVLKHAQNLAHRKGTPNGIVSLRSINARTLEGTVIASLVRPLQATTSGYEWPYHRYVINANGPTLRWALVSCCTSAARAPTHADVTWFDGTERREFVVPAAGAGWREPRLLDGGATLEVNHYGAPLPPATRVDLATGVQTSAPSSFSTLCGQSADGRWQLVPGTTYLELLDTRSGRTVACTNVPAPGGYASAVSADGRRVACVTQGTSGFMSPTFVVGVWDTPGADAVTDHAAPNEP